MDENKEYLGDGVYATDGDGAIKLTVENGIHTTQTIYLETEVLDALNRYVEKMGRIAKATKE